MSDRVKLARILFNSPNLSTLYNSFDEFEEAADHLISHGVVVREWIPVEERFPDLELVEAMSNDTDFYPCLAVIKHERLMGRRYISKLWYDKNGFIDGDCIDRTSSVTHWMPLPELPMREGEDDGQL